MDETREAAIRTRLYRHQQTSWSAMVDDLVVELDETRRQRDAAREDNDRLRAEIAELRGIDTDTDRSTE